MIIKLDHYRKSKTRAIIDSYYSQQVPGDAAPERGPAKILHAPWRAAAQQAESRESAATPEQT